MSEQQMPLQQQPHRISFPLDPQIVKNYMKEHGVNITTACKNLGVNVATYYGAVKRVKDAAKKNAPVKRTVTPTHIQIPLREVPQRTVPPSALTLVTEMNELRDEFSKMISDKISKLLVQV